MFFLYVKASKVPAVRDLSRVSFPHLQKQGSPERHESCEKDSSRVVNQVRKSGMEAGFLEAPVVTEVITQWTHGDIQVVVADVITGRMIIDSGDGVQEAKEANN